TLQRRLDGAADDELLAHDLDGGGDGLADDRLAQAPDQTLEEVRQVAARFIVDVDQLAGQHQAPGRGVDEQAVRLTQVRGPVGRDRKSTRLNSSHVKISYAVFCLKKKNIR